MITVDYKQEFMNLAASLSLQSPCRFKVGAVLSKGNKVLASGTNLNKTHPKFGSGPYKYLHAEGNVLWIATRMGYDINNTIIYIYRQNNNLAKPCSYCQNMLDKYNIKSFYSPINLKL